MSFARIVWLEKGKELEDVVPANWVSGSVVYFPKKDLKRKIADCEMPSKDWLKYHVKKVKTTGKQLQLLIYLFSFKPSS
jgi:hypothetical protein